MVSHIIAASAVSVLLTGCHLPGNGPMPTLTTGGQSLQASREEPPEGCKEVGPVTGSGGDVMGEHGTTGAVEAARINMRNEAAAKGANYVRVETGQGSVGLELGTAFACP